MDRALMYSVDTTLISVYSVDTTVISVNSVDTTVTSMYSVDTTVIYSLKEDMYSHGNIYLHVQV
jgi:hypothetical protein